MHKHIKINTEGKFSTVDYMNWINNKHSEFQKTTGEIRSGTTFFLDIFTKSVYNIDCKYFAMFIPDMANFYYLNVLFLFSTLFRCFS